MGERETSETLPEWDDMSQPCCVGLGRPFNWFRRVLNRWSHRMEIDQEQRKRVGEFTLLGDRPETRAGDALGFEDVASKLASVILASHSSAPFTLGIEAGWGMGKSSLMGQLRRQLETKPDIEVVPVWYNAWTAEGDDVLEGLIKSVLDKIDKNILRRMLRQKKLVAGAKALTFTIAQWLKISDAVNVFWDKATSDARVRNELRDLLKATLDEWASKTEAGGRLLVIFIDDLDRCSPESVFRVFEAVKLYLDSPHFIFVIGFDQQVISEVILKEKKYSDSTTSRGYLEKIVQTGYPIPKPSDDLVKDLINRYMQESGTTKIFDEAAKSLIIEQNERNPRRIKRFINWFILEHNLDSVSTGLPPTLLIKTLILHMYFFDFRRLFGERAGDPIKEFLDYLDLRELIDKGETKTDRPSVAAVFGAHHLPVPSEIDAEALKTLEDRLPESFPALVGNVAFVSLVRDLDEAARMRMRYWLERRGESLSALGEIDETSSFEEEISGIGRLDLSILWVDDKPESVKQLVNTIQNLGGVLILRPSTREAEAVLESFTTRFDVLISDITREGREDKGLKDVDEWRNLGLYDGPVAFYTSRITPERRARAARLNAEIHSTPSGLLKALARIADRKTQAIQSATGDDLPMRSTTAKKVVKRRGSMAPAVVGGRYTLLERVGAGLYGEIYSARDEMLSRQVAVKVLSEHFSRDSSFAERFHRELQAAALAHHPNIVSLYDYGVDNGTNYMVMEFIDGEPLSEIIRDQGPLTPKRAIEVASDVAMALQHAYARGLVHRALKPSNIMLTSSGQTKVTDLGMPQAFGDAEQSMTQTEGAIGVTAYLSPEQVSGKPVNAHSIVYSLGAILFEMLTGRPPFRGETLVLIAHKHLMETPPEPSSLNVEIPEALDEVVLKALAKDPENRYSDIQDFLTALERVRSVTGRKSL
jgi:CheY-like chemotaxis protein